MLPALQLRWWAWHILLTLSAKGSGMLHALAICNSVQVLVLQSHGHGVEAQWANAAGYVPRLDSAGVCKDES